MGTNVIASYFICHWYFFGQCWYDTGLSLGVSVLDGADDLPLLSFTHEISVPGMLVVVRVRPLAVFV